jgi:hypothetical protein
MDLKTADEFFEDFFNEAKTRLSKSDPELVAKMNAFGWVLAKFFFHKGMDAAFDSVRRFADEKMIYRDLIRDGKA